MMDYRPQQPGEHDFTYAGRILKAAGTNFDAMLANGSFSLDELWRLREKILGVVSTQIEPLLAGKKREEVTDARNGT